MRAKNKYLQIFLMATALFGISFSVIFSLLFFISFGDLHDAMMVGIVSGGVFGLLAGLLYSTLSTLFVFILSLKMNKVRSQVVHQYGIIYDGMANYWDGKISLGGWMFLTKNFLYFIPHRFNFNTGEIKILYENIDQAIKPAGTRKFDLTKIKSMDVLCKGGQIESFSVNGRDAWIEILNETIKSCISHSTCP